jgi:transcriptional coactivator HFI1/ADA1
MFINPTICLSYNRTGRLNQSEYSSRIDPILASPTGEKDHLHNQLIAAIYGNVTREMPDIGLAPWVSANDKPTTTTGSKPVSGDAAERRLKGEVMQLPARDRRRIKELTQNEVRCYFLLRCFPQVLTNCPFSTV